MVLAGLARETGRPAAESWPSGSSYRLTG